MPVHYQAGYINNVFSCSQTKYPNWVDDRFLVIYELASKRNL